MAAVGRNFRNWISWAGLLLSASAMFAFVLLLVIDQLSGRQNPYLGILAGIVAPGFFFLGIFLALLGAFVQRRKQRRANESDEPHAITIDLSRTRDRRVLMFFAAGSVAFLLMTAVGSY